MKKAWHGVLALVIAAAAAAQITSMVTYPGGTTGQLQYNSGSRFTAVAGSTVTGQNLALSGTMTATQFIGPVAAAGVDFSTITARFVLVEASTGNLYVTKLSTGTPVPTNLVDLSTVTAGLALKVAKAGDTMTGDLNGKSIILTGGVSAATGAFTGGPGLAVTYGVTAGSFTASGPLSYITSGASITASGFFGNGAALTALTGANVVGNIAGSAALSVLKAGDSMSGLLTLNSPGRGLNVVGVVGNPMYIGFDQSANAGKIWRLGQSGGVAGFSTFDIYDLTSNITPFYISNADNGVFQYGVTAGSVTVTGPATVVGSMTVQGAGSIGGLTGIGTNAPLSGASAILDVKQAVNRHILTDFWTAGSMVQMEAVNDAFSANVPWNIVGNPLVLNGPGGSVGIGVAAPLASLQVGPGTQAPLSTSKIMASALSGGASMSVRDVASSSEGILYTDGNGVIVGAYTNHDLKILANNAEAMRIKAGGSVGIGTASPGSIFHVQSTSHPVVTIYDNRSNQLQGSVVSEISFQTADTDMVSSTAAAIRILADADDFGRAGTMAFYTAQQAQAAAEKMRLTHDGKLGIGTVSPGSKLDILDAGYGEIVRVGSGANRVGLGVNAGGAGYCGGIYVGGTLGGTFCNGGLALGSAVTNPAANTLYVANVGIGTYAPATKLHMSSGTLLIDGTAGGLKLANIASGTQCLQAAADGTVTGTGSSCGSGSTGAFLSSTQTFSGVNTFTSGVVISSSINVGAAGAYLEGNTSNGLMLNNSNLGAALWAKSIDGATQSSGCLVAVGMDGNAANSVLTFTSTTTALSIHLNIRAGILLESCAPGSFCKVGVSGIYRTQDTATSYTWANNNVVVFGGTRCKTTANGSPVDNTTLGSSMSPTTDASGFYWVRVGGP